MKTLVLMSGAFTAAFVLSAATTKGDVFSLPADQTSLQFITVGDTGNLPDLATGGTLGSVEYSYKIGKFDVTLAQYTAFLNSVAATDSYGLYNTGMGNSYSTQGISRTGNSGSFSYSVTGSAPQAENMPAFSITWGDAARFCNWLQNGQPTGLEGNGTTENGAYTLNGGTSNAALSTVPRNAGALYFIPTENEWYKAAYYVGGGTDAGYWAYPTRSNTSPSNSLSATGTNNSNYVFADPTNFLTPVGYFNSSPGPYMTYDMGGDVAQWNEATTSGVYRELRGGSYADLGADALASSNSRYEGAADKVDFVGFRVGSSAVVPEPSSFVLLLTCGLISAAAARFTTVPPHGPSPTATVVRG